LSRRFLAAINVSPMKHISLLLILPYLFVSCALQGKKDEANAYKAPRAKIVAATAPSGPLRVDISLSSMTAQLLQGKDTLLAEMDVSTGEAGHRTPKGVFRISEKMPLKRSNLYGQYVNKDTREVVVARHWEHKGPRPAGTVFQGIAMPYWMRLTAGGVGMHVGQFPRGITTSKGCIRCPEEGQTFFYQHCRIGTPVKIHEGPHPLPSVLAE
jgi:lipoprotein-anchoring transpeptidase ErfK/SrfK